MATPPSYGHGRRGTFCKNMDTLTMEANNTGLSDLEIASEIGCDPSTVWNWRKKGKGDKNLARKLYQLTIKRTDSIEPLKTIDQSTQTQKNEKFTEIDLSVGGQRIGKITVFNEKLKTILKD